MTASGSVLHRYHRRSAAFTGDPMRAATALAAGAEPGAHLLYEGPEHWVHATGVLAEIYVDPDGVHLRGVREEDVPWDGRPLEHVQDMLTTLPVEGWHAYGWAAFELHHSCSHGAAPEHGRSLHLVVPRTEVRIRPGEVEVRATDPAEAAATFAALRRTRPLAAGVAETVAVREHGVADYQDRVRRALEIIRSGEAEKIILSRRVPIGRSIDFPRTYLSGREGNQPVRSFLMDLGGIRAAGFCPEIVATVDTSGLVTVRPLAGTRARSTDRAENVRLREELRRDAKEVYEHAISVKQACDAVSPVCLPDSVLVEEFMAVRERGPVQHLGSTVTGRLADGRSPWDAFEAAFPSVTASGIPKVEACAAIRHLEGAPRGLYSGAVLSVDQDGTFDSALVLRGVYGQDGATWLQAGAGIIGQSTPEREFEETCEKLQSMARFVVYS